MGLRNVTINHGYQRLIRQRWGSANTSSTNGAINRLNVKFIVHKNRHRGHSLSLISVELNKLRHSSATDYPCTNKLKYISLAWTCSFC